MRVLKWLRRERVTVTTRHSVSPGPTAREQVKPQSTSEGTIRTEDYKRDLAEFQARRHSGHKQDTIEVTPVKKSKCGRRSLPVSCTSCTAVSPDKTFNYEKRSALKYKKNTSHKRTRSANADEHSREGVPNIQFLFQNQVFMPGNARPTSYSEPPKCRRFGPNYDREDVCVKRQIDFKEDVEKEVSSPLFFKNNSLPYDVDNFLQSSSDEEADAKTNAGAKSSSHSDEVDNPNDSVDKLQEVMSELRSFDQWADEQLKMQSLNSSRSEGNKSDTSVYGVPVADMSDLDIAVERSKEWNRGQWGVVQVQMKKMPGVTMEHVRKKQNSEVEILKKCRHPNIVLLMGLYPDIHHIVHLICEHFVDTLYNILHVQGLILTAQKAVDYASDIASALVFLRMHGYLHTELNSSRIVITGHDAAKLAGLDSCTKLATQKPNGNNKQKIYEINPQEPVYVNIDATLRSSNTDCEPLISQTPSEAYLATSAVAKEYRRYSNSAHYRWQAPELFLPDGTGRVWVCGRSDVYSLALVLWECCNAVVPWKSLSYSKLKELYVLWKTGIRLPQDGTYPGTLLELMQMALKQDRSERVDLKTAEEMLQNVKRQLRELPDIIIPARLTKKRSNFSTVGWDSTSPSDSDILSPVSTNIEHAIVHKPDHTILSEKSTPRDYDTGLYESIQQDVSVFTPPEKGYIAEDESETDNLRIRNITNTYDDVHDKYSSACSTPISKVTARMKNIGTPGALHRTDSTEYCSILSPNMTPKQTTNLNKSRTEIERSATKLSRSFTPKSYKPLHITVPEMGNLDCIKSLHKDGNEVQKTSSYNFDIKNYSLPTTPIARSNKLRKNAWLSGDLGAEKRVNGCDSSHEDVSPNSLVTPRVSLNSEEKDTEMFSNDTHRDSISHPTSDNAAHQRFQRNQQEMHSPETFSVQWSQRSSERGCADARPEEEPLAGVNVKPLVAIHERWIYEANKKTGRSLSLPEDNRCLVSAMKPASHCVDPLQRSLPQLPRRPPSHPPLRAGGLSEQFCQARDSIAKSITFSAKDPPSGPAKCWRADDNHWSPKSKDEWSEPKLDQATDTVSIEEFIKDLIRREFRHLISEVSDDMSPRHHKGDSDELVDKGMVKVLEALKSTEELERSTQTEEIPSAKYSRIKINSNNKPLLQITFTRNGENRLQVLDSCVNVTIGDAKEGVCQNVQDSLTAEDLHSTSLKRCQGFSAIREARSTEDLYIDDELSTHMQENFGGKVKLIPLHGSLHEILCEKEDDCCLVKVKQENGCDTIYFRCDNSDTESRDALDGSPSDKACEDTVVYKRSISLIEERIQRIKPKDKRPNTHKVPVTSEKNDEPILLKVRPKSEVFFGKVNSELRARCNSSPSLIQGLEKLDEVEVNLENAMCYQDSSSDECLKYQTDSDEFERLEKKIEEDVAKSNSLSFNLGYLEKISEENLSTMNEEYNGRELCSIHQNNSV